MKTKFKRIGKQSLSIVLAVMMMVSTMLVGMVTSNAAEKSTKLYFAYSGSYDVWPENWGGTEQGNWYKATAEEGKTFQGKQVYYCLVYNDSTGVNLHFKNGNTVTGDISNIINNESVNNYTSKIYVVNDSSNGGEWVDYTTTTTHNVTVTYNAAHVSSIKLGNDNVASSGAEVTVNNGATPTLEVTLKPNCSITSVTQGSTALTAESDGTYKLQAVTAATTITVNTTSSSSGGEGTATTYKLMRSTTSDGVGDDAGGNSSKGSPTVYLLSDGTYSVKVSAGTFKQGNNYFALSSDGKNSGIVSISSVEVEPSLKSIITNSNVQGWNPNPFVFIACSSDISTVDVNVTYKDGKYTISRAAASNYTVSAKGQYTFDGSTYNDYTSNPPTITIASPTVTAGASVAVTATDYVAGYKFIGWHSYNGIFADESALSTTFTPNADGAVAIAKYAKELTATVTKAAESSAGTWSGDKTSYFAGETVTITFTPNNSETDMVTNVTVNGESKITSLVDNTLTFTAGVSSDDLSAMEIVVTFGARPQHRFYVDYVTGCDSTMGTFTSLVTSGGTYDYNTEITLTAAPATGYTFVGWYNNINGTGDRLSTDTAYKFKLTADTEIYAKFAENTGTMISGLYLIYSDSSSNPTDFTKFLNLYRNADNTVYAYFDNETFDASKTYYFMISTSTGSNAYTSAYNSGSNTATTTSDTVSALPGEHWVGSTHYFFGKFSVPSEKQDIVSSVKINLGYYNATQNIVAEESTTDDTKAYSYEVIPNTSGAVVNKIKIYAKDGTIRSTYQKYAEMADTVLSAADGVLTKYSNTPDYYEEAYAPVGSTINVTTTINEANKGTYFVKAFCINGISYGINDSSKAVTANGVYTCTYTIPEDCTDKFIEITPIYYYINDEDAVTFYVEGFEENVQEVWGNTIAVQAWYNNGSETADATSDTKNALGGYPGQPLVYEGGKYSMQIPKYLNGVKKNTVKGITLNNYIWDDIHKKIGKTNAQTYDYDDFVKLANKQDADNIIFDFRYRTTIDNKPSQLGLTESTYEASELEPLTDYYGNIVDLFGNELSESWTTDFDSTYLTVISTGYVRNYIGKYATEWSVYDHEGKYITTINCSQLLDEATVNSAYTSAYNTLKPYANLPVKIAYEKSIFSGDDPGNRADGRWYYSTKSKKITSNVIIEYRDNNDDSFDQDVFETDASGNATNVGTITGTKAYFTNADYYGKTSCEGEVDGGKFSVRAETDSAASYYFIGWYLKTSDGYAFMSNDPDYDIPMTNNETYVARFIPTPSGTLTLSHTLLDGSAIGRTYIKADIVSGDGKTVLYSIPETSGNLVVPSKYVTYTSTNKIVVTLRTVPYGNDTVEGFYDSEENKYDDATAVDGTTGEKTYTRERLIKYLFTEGQDSEGNTTYTLTKSNIPYYSKITSKPLNYEITYTYKTRLDGVKKYVIKDTVSGIELEEMWAANVAAGVTKEQLSKAFITKKAPFVSNYREEITWDMDKVTISGYTATVSANTRTDVLNISALTVDGQWTQPATVKYGELAMSNGDYLYKTGTTEFPKTFNGYDFSFWAIFDNKDEAQKYSNAVNIYMSDNPDANMSQRLTALTTRDGYKNLISKSYSKEYNYISYQNYYIVPVYAGRFAKNEINESQASIRLLEYTRNQWTNDNGVKGDGELNTGGTKTDYLYTDFALSFDKDQLLIQNSKNIKVGIVLEVVDKYNNVTDLKSYQTDSNTSKIEAQVKAASNNGKIGSYTYGDNTRNLYRYEIDNSTISVKNRIEYYLRFKNSETSQQNVMKVYSYIYDTSTGDIYLSNPVYMNMYEIGNLTYITSDLASIDLGSAQ